MLGSSGRARARAILGHLSLALGLKGLPGDLLHHVGALLLGHGDALPSSGVGALLLVHVSGHRSQVVLADLLGLVAAHLAGSVHIFANLGKYKNEKDYNKDDNNLPVWRLGYTSGW